MKKRHPGFNVHNWVRAKTRKEAERVGKYMIQPLLVLERLSFSEKEAKVCYRYGKEAKEMERMGYLEFIARVTSHIPDTRSRSDITACTPMPTEGRARRRTSPLFLSRWWRTSSGPFLSPASSI